MRMKLIGLACCVILLLAGCATSPPIPSFETKRGDRVGLLVDIGDGPLHTHIGTTVFNNFEKKYPYQWRLDSTVAEVLRTTLSKSGFTVVDLENEGIRYNDVTPLVIGDGEKWKVAPGKENTVRELAERKVLKAVVVVKEARVMTALECAGGPCSEHYANASGLYTRSFLGLTRYKAVAGFALNVYVLNPPADISRADPLRTMMRMPAIPLGNYPTPANFEQITEAELLPVRDAILKFSEQMAAEIAKALNPK
jgi:hypothetical protein